MRPLFIGDEVTAAAYRLAGLDTQVVAATAAEAALQQARTQERPLILITAECAAAIAASRLDAALAAFRPPILIVGDAADRVALPDFARRARAVLGIAG